METVVLIAMILVCFNFLLKQTYVKPLVRVITALSIALFLIATWHYAIEQSKTQIADWLKNPQLMLDISVILSIEVIIEMAFCLLSVQMENDSPITPRKKFIYRVLRYFPGFLIYPVMFSLLVYLIFSLPGYSFSMVAWSTAIAVFVLVIAGSYLFQMLIPEKEVRLELLFMTNALLAIIGIVATVNGRTHVMGVSEVNWGALGGILLLMIVGTIIGIVARRIKMNIKLRNKNILK